MKRKSYIKDIKITPILIPDPPLLNSVGVHEPFALRIIVEIQTGDGLVGYGECAGGSARLAALETACKALVGMDIYETSRMESVIPRALPHASTNEKASVFSPFEVAALDIQGKIADLPVVDLLGGKVRDAVPFSAYLFYRWERHPNLDGREFDVDDWGAATDPAGIVRQAKRMVADYGFQSIKLKGGVFPPEVELDAIRALKAEFPDHPIRLDPNGVWSVETSIQVARDAVGLLEYLEDPTMGQEGMSRVSQESNLPLATNMCVVSFDHLRRSVELNDVQVILGDHHYWGGLRRTRELGAFCEAFNIGLSMHSNSHLGISLAAMVHVAAATPALTYACDTHYPWNGQYDVVEPGPFTFVDGSLAVPDGPGLGVQVNQSKIDELHNLYVREGMTRRDDTGYMRRIDPTFDDRVPRW